MIGDSKISLANEGAHGKRGLTEDKKRLISLLVVLAILVLLELTLGRSFEKTESQAILNDKTNWLVKEYKLPPEYRLHPDDTKKRIVYVSNSHAKTGGYVAQHLQDILEELFPGVYDVLDMAEAGIFAPDMLQRSLFSLEYDPEILIVSPSYISFSDRMRLAMQSHGVRAFFRDGVFDKLQFSFWLRNYDLSLFSDELTKSYVRLFRYRDKLRASWSEPLSNSLMNVFNVQRSAFLEMDINQVWRFPDGYDRNLFQWRLYASGRDGHMKDMQELVNAAKLADVKLVAYNMPADFNKSEYIADQDDVDAFRYELSGAFSEAVFSRDYQSDFPVEFTTYDALHPTWHGARLHALDMVFHLNDIDALNDKLSETEIVTAFFAIESSTTDFYKDILSGYYPPYERPGFRRYDLFEGHNAKSLLRRLNTFRPGSQQENGFIHGLSKRIYYWDNIEMHLDDSTLSNFNPAWVDAFRKEMELSQERLEHFSHELTKLQEGRLKYYPIPDIQLLKPVQTRTIPHNNKTVLSSTYKYGENGVVQYIQDNNGKGIAYLVRNNNQLYSRVDAIGDGSYLLFEISNNIGLPIWFDGYENLPRWGI